MQAPRAFFPYLITQRGVATLPISLIILVLMTIITLYAARVGVLETRTSANKQRAEQAFSAAEFASEQGVAFTQFNEERIFSTVAASGGWSSTNMTPSTSAVKWITCPESTDSVFNGLSEEYIPPCAFIADDDERERWMIVLNAPSISLSSTCADVKVNGTTDDAHKYPDGRCDDDSGFSQVAGKDARMHLMTKCRDLNADGDCDNLQPYDYPVITILAAAQSADGTGISRIEQSVLFYDAFPGDTNSPAPLMAAGLAGTGGNFNIVVNPDADPKTPLEQPLALWTGGNVTITSGAAGTCYLGDVGVNGFLGSGGATTTGTYYALDSTTHLPTATQKTITLCRTCTCPTAATAAHDPTSGAITIEDSWPPEEDILDIDDEGANEGHINKWLDTTFPNDLFQFIFGVPAASYQVIKDNAQVLECDEFVELGTHASTRASTGANGVYWIEGDCAINGGDDIGWFGPTSLTPGDAGYTDGPAIVVIEGNLRVNGTSQLVGIFFVFSPTNAQLEVDLGGGPTFYGALLSNNTLDLTGTYKARYEQVVFDNLNSGGVARGFARLPGSWKDY
jgi:hypothetical protein